MPSYPDKRTLGLLLGKCPSKVFWSLLETRKQNTRNECSFLVAHGYSPGSKSKVPRPPGPCRLNWAVTAWLPQALGPVLGQITYCELCLLC